MNHCARILITVGEPAGIGPDIALMAASLTWPAELIVVGDIQCLSERARLLGLTIDLMEWTPNATPPSKHRPNTLKVLCVPQAVVSVAGHPDRRNAQQVLQCLNIAGQLCLDKKTDALVTGPVHKALIHSTQNPFMGHTEYFAALSHSPLPVMLFVTPVTRVALLTTHLPLAKVPAALTKERLQAVIRILHRGLRDTFRIPSPHILVCGLNPHAGEDGLLGNEEQDIMIPALNELQNEGMQLTGPIAADTAFTQNKLKTADAILAMYHDQALPAVKCMAFGDAVNVTLGLPFIRTSVDHGVAFDRAGTGQANPQSFISAIQQAITLSANPALDGNNIE